MRCEVDYAARFSSRTSADRKVSRDLALDLDLFSRGALSSARNRAAGLRRAHRAARNLEAQKTGAGSARVSGKLLPFLRLGSRI